MINRSDLLKDLQGLLPHIERDILAYSEASPELDQHLKDQYQAAWDAGRTAEHFVDWRAALITQAAVAWVLTCVFVRFLEDNGLLAEPVLAGPVRNARGENALQQARDRMVAYFNEHPTHEERHYLLDLFAELEQFPVVAELLDHRHNPLWQIPVSADGAKRLIDFFQKLDADSGEIRHDFTDPQWDTRFLGDLYQDLSESVSKRYALMQTPEFVESLIIDYTLEPAIQTFGLPGLRLIDPTCGSGHFLLTTFERVFDRWLKREPGTNPRVLAQYALDVVHGTDINPYAIAICRFRLLIAAMKAAEVGRLREAPHFHFNLACGDSLLHGRRFEWEGQGIQGALLDDEHQHVYEVEDAELLNRILGQRYHVVVGNPPYITVKDKALNQLYRDRYTTCHRKYSLGAPFTERFFDLTLWPQGNQPAGFMGMITANSFMKREFGKKLIEEYLPRKDLTHVIDTSGAYIPGHGKPKGTPTAILFARNRAPQADVVRTVMGIRSEPGTPENLARGMVWGSIVDLINEPGSENDYISVVDQGRASFGKHPWIIGGGGAAELKELIDSKAQVLLGDICVGLGFGAITGEDEVYLVPKQNLRFGIVADLTREFVEGDLVRDWAISSNMDCVFPYDSLIGVVYDKCVEAKFWPSKTILKGRVYFGKTQAQRGLSWYEYGYISKDKCAAKLLISYAFVATHNHFVLDRGGKVFKQSAPVIELSDGAAEADHFTVLGLLNSSTACFWGRQVFFGKGGFSDGKWQERVEWDGTKLKSFPLAEDPQQDVMRLAEQLDRLALELAQFQPTAVLKTLEPELARQLESARIAESQIQGQMVAVQEELDWRVYHLYGLTDTPLCYAGELPVIELGQRSFEIELARSLQAGESETIWFEHHGSTPITEIPIDWPLEYKDLVQHRLDEIQNNQWIKLIDNKDHKRRWNLESWEDRLHAAAREWLLDRCEQACQSAGLQTSAQLADRLRRDADVLRVAEVYCGNDLADLQALVCELVDGDNVPQMAAARLKAETMPKFRAWQETWEKQRLEDAIDARHGVAQPLPAEDAQDPEKKAKWELAKAWAELEKQEQVGDIPVPPQYKPVDFRKPSYWSLRGKLDVPKERFFSLPGCEKEGDSTLVIGWAGLDHLQRATSIASWYLQRKEGEGWSAERLLPMLVALDELIPWLKQWHNEIDPEFGERMGDYYEGFLLEELRQLELPRAALAGWQPAAASGQKRGRKKKATDQA